MHDLKKEVAKAALSYLKPQQLIGLGAGSTVNHLVNLIQQEISFNSTLQFVSPSLETENLLIKAGLNCLSGLHQHRLDYYFDGCDQVDENLNALKSGGGIHSNEKIYASMADSFFLLVDAEKLVPQLTTKFPLCVEILPQAVNRVIHRIQTLYEDYSVKISIRKSDKKIGPLRSDHGNYLLDVYFETMPDLFDLNNKIKLLTGVVEHSLFYQIADHVLVADEHTIRLLTTEK